MQMTVMMMLVSPSFNFGKTLLIALVIGLIVAAIAVGSMASKLKTVSQRREANDYVTKGSLKMQVCRDNYLYKKTERRPRAQQNSTPQNDAPRQNGPHGRPPAQR